MGVGASLVIKDYHLLVNNGHTIRLYLWRLLLCFQPLVFHHNSLFLLLLSDPFVVFGASRMCQSQMDVIRPHPFPKALVQCCHYYRVLQALRTHDLEQSQRNHV